MKAACISLLGLPSDLFSYSLAPALSLPLCLFLRFDIEPHYITYTGLGSEILLSQTFRRWNYRCVTKSLEKGLVWFLLDILKPPNTMAWLALRRWWLLIFVLFPVSFWTISFTNKREPLLHPVRTTVSPHGTEIGNIKRHTSQCMFSPREIGICT